MIKRKNILYVPQKKIYGDVRSEEWSGQTVGPNRPNHFRGKLIQKVAP
jgi:hypothetical protein